MVTLQSPWVDIRRGHCWGDIPAGTSLPYHTPSSMPVTQEYSPAGGHTASVNEGVIKDRFEPCAKLQIKFEQTKKGVRWEQDGRWCFYVKLSKQLDLLT